MTFLEIGISFPTWDVIVAAAHLTGISAFFYANNGQIDGINESNVQEGLNFIVDLFHHMGL
jgi:hypothetical protein